MPEQSRMTGGPSRRALFRAAAALGVAPGALGPGLLGAEPAFAEPAFAPVPTPAPTPAGPIVKPLPPELFRVLGTNAETRWEALRGTGHLTPVDRFFVRNHTSTPRIDARTWRLQLFGTGLRGAPTAERPVSFTYAQLRALPARDVTAVIECAGNGRVLFTEQQGQTVSGTAWRLGAIGAARGAVSRSGPCCARPASPTVPSRCCRPGSTPTTSPTA